MKKLDGKTALCRLKSRTTIVSWVVSQWDLSIPFPASRFDNQLAQFETQMTSTGIKIFNIIKLMYFQQYKKKKISF